MFTSAQQYLRTVDEGKASCVVIAIGLRGGISGLELGGRSCRRAVRSRSSSSRDSRRGDAREAFRIGCVAYIEEPVSSESLIAAIRLSGARKVHRPLSRPRLSAESPALADHGDGGYGPPTAFTPSAPPSPCESPIRAKGAVLGELKALLDGAIEQRELQAQFGVAMRRKRLQQVVEHRAKSPDDLDAAAAAMADLGAGQVDEVLPVRREVDESKLPVASRSSSLRSAATPPGAAGDAAGRSP
jgi:hypothetical protein